MEIKQMEKCPYPVPVIEPNQWDYEEYCWPSILTCDKQNANYCEVHGNRQT